MSLNKFKKYSVLSSVYLPVDDLDWSSRTLDDDRRSCLVDEPSTTFPTSVELQIHRMAATTSPDDDDDDRRRDDSRLDNDGKDDWSCSPRSVPPLPHLPPHLLHLRD